jgi:hypothetical protein
VSGSSRCVEQVIVVVFEPVGKFVGVGGSANGIGVRGIATHPPGVVGVQVAHYDGGVGRLEG